MHLYPVLDWYGPAALIVLFAVLRDVERSWPLRHRIDRWARRLRINAAIALPALAVLRLLTVPVAIAAAVWSDEHHFGLARVVPGPPWVAIVVAWLVLDYGAYLWHRLLHAVPWFWRFHRVHHSDVDVDVSTALRVHFGEVVLGLPVRALQVALSGATLEVALAYELCLAAMSVYHHSNLKLPRAVDRLLNKLIITPRAHGIHHSTVALHRNSNFSCTFNLWDRVHRTLRLDIRQDDLVMGLPQYRDAAELTVGCLLAMPFGRSRPEIPAVDATTDPLLRRGSGSPVGGQSRRDSR